MKINVKVYVRAAAFDLSVLKNDAAEAKAALNSRNKSVSRTALGGR